MARNFTVKTVHKKMYPGINFKDEADGAEPTGWVSNNGADCTTTVIASLNGHRKVLQLYDGNAATSAIIYRTFTQGLNTVVEIWFTKSSIGASTSIFMRLKEGATTIIYLRFQDDDLDNYPNGGPFASIKDNFLVANTLSHFKFIFNDTTNTYDCYIDGILEGAGIAYANDSTSGIDTIYFETESTHSGFYGYVDAIGVSTDTSYKIGDNVHYRHFKESTDSFEGDDVGKQGTDITWVDAVDTVASVEIVQEFNEHKKLLRQNYGSGAGGFDYSQHTFASQSKNGWDAFWIKVTDVTGDSFVYLSESGVADIIGFAISASKFKCYKGVVFSDVTGAPTPVNDTWYLIYIKWVDAANDTFDLWIDNIQYESGTQCKANQTNGIDTKEIRSYADGGYVYIDAPISSLDSDERADNRTFDYHDTYTKTDITADVINIPNYNNKLYAWRTATLYTKSSYKFTNVFFEIYDVNSKLAMRGEIKNRNQNDKIWEYPLRDMNWDDLNEPITNVFATNKIHDPTDSTSMLKVALPNVSHLDGDLILAEADTKAATYSPTLRFYPTHMFLRDISDLGDTVTIVKASGIVLLDDDLASGDSLDVDIAADKKKMTTIPYPIDILETINYFEIFGAINPDTGERFHKIIDNSGTDKKRKWRYLNNEFRSQTDVDAYATALTLRAVPIKIIRIEVQGLGAHDMGTTLNYKYIKGSISIAQTNYYIISETINFDKNLATIILSEGMIEESKYSYAFERPQNYVNSYASAIYETDINTVFPRLVPVDGATEATSGVKLDAVGEIVRIFFYTPPNIDDSRVIDIYFVFKRVDGNADTITVKKTLTGEIADGTGTTVSQWTGGAATLTACDADNIIAQKFTLTAANNHNNYRYLFQIELNEAARELNVNAIGVTYYVKRSV